MYKKQKVTRKTDKSNVLRQYKRPAGKVKISESVSISNSFSASGGIMAQLSRQKFNIFIRTKFTENTIDRPKAPTDGRAKHDTFSI